MIYLDYNAKAPLHAAAREAWLDAQERYPANPASEHRAGQRSDHAMEGAREWFSGMLGCRAGELVFLSGATEAANAVMAYLSGKEGEVWMSSVEHPCVLAAGERWFPGRVRYLPVDGRGVLELGSLDSGGRPGSVWVMAANNETGVLQPWREVLGWCRERGIPMVCDATQWVGRLPAEEFGGCDYVFGSGQKFGGPVGTGFLKVSSGFRGLIEGGGQEEGRRGGTQDVAGVLAMVAALRAAVSGFRDLEEREIIRGRVERALRLGVPGVRLVGDGVDRLWNTVTMVFPELSDCRQRWVVRMDAAGVAVSTGSACAGGREEGSHVLGAMGFSKEEAGRTLRWSGGWETAEAEWMRAVDAARGVWARFGS